MDEDLTQIPCYKLDQQILHARGIKMLISEVADLPASAYSARLQELSLTQEDVEFLNCLRRRIKNRRASQRLRQRGVQHIIGLNRELRWMKETLRECSKQLNTLESQRDRMRERCDKLSSHILQVLKERGDQTDLPQLDETINESHFISKKEPKVFITLLKVDNKPRLENENKPISSNSSDYAAKRLSQNSNLKTNNKQRVLNLNIKEENKRKNHE